jgi:hypothetical protein
MIFPMACRQAPGLRLHGQQPILRPQTLTQTHQHLATMSKIRCGLLRVQWRYFSQWQPLLWRRASRASYTVYCSYYHSLAAPGLLDESQDDHAHSLDSAGGVAVRTCWKYAATAATS